MKEGYRILEHPSDIGLEAEGKSLKEVFEYAALGLVAAIAEPSSIDPVEERFVSITGSDVENLLVRWLSEILYLYDGHGYLVSDCTIRTIDEKSLEARLTGEILNPQKHRLKLDVKAITYHQLVVRQDSAGSYLKVFFDI